MSKHNRSEARRSAARIGRRAACLALAVAGVGVAVGATAASASTPTSTAGPGSDTTTVSWNWPGELGGWQSAYIPKLVCPASHPYLLKQNFNPGSGFRLFQGIEMSNYRQGFDAVALSTLWRKYDKGDGATHFIAVGTSGERDMIMNSVTNWALTPTPWTVTIHCTSDPDKGTISMS